jgi:outer membrane protein assembly factor BamD (BamD/ComL family)
MKLKISVLFIVLVLGCVSVVFADGSQRLYVSGVKAAKKGDLASAFMSFRSLLENFPDSSYTQEALFATAEYYFLLADFTDARPAFIRFIAEYPESKARPFALVYLSKIAQSQEQKALAESLQKIIVTSQQLVLLFRDFKEFEYLSLLNRKYRAVHFIDKVEFYIDGELFTQISY